MTIKIAKTHVLRVEVSANDEQTILVMVEQLARTACDIANSTDDENATIIIWDDDRGADSHMPVGVPEPRGAKQ